MSSRTSTSRHETDDEKYYHAENEPSKNAPQKQVQDSAEDQHHRVSTAEGMKPEASLFSPGHYTDQQPHDVQPLQKEKVEFDQILQQLRGLGTNTTFIVNHTELKQTNLYQVLLPQFILIESTQHRCLLESDFVCHTANMWMKNRYTLRDIAPLARILGCNRRKYYHVADLLTKLKSDNHPETVEFREYINQTLKTFKMNQLAIVDIITAIFQNACRHDVKCIYLDSDPQDNVGKQHGRRCQEKKAEKARAKDAAPATKDKIITPVDPNKPQEGGDNPPQQHYSGSHMIAPPTGIKLSADHSKAAEEKLAVSKEQQQQQRAFEKRATTGKQRTMTNYPPQHPGEVVYTEYGHGQYYDKYVPHQQGHSSPHYYHRVLHHRGGGHHGKQQPHPQRRVRGHGVVPDYIDYGYYGPNQQHQYHHQQPMYQQYDYIDEPGRGIGSRPSSHRDYSPGYAPEMYAYHIEPPPPPPHYHHPAHPPYRLPGRPGPSADGHGPGPMPTMRHSSAESFQSPPSAGGARLNRKERRRMYWAKHLQRKYNTSPEIWWPDQDDPHAAEFHQQAGYDTMNDHPKRTPPYISRHYAMLQQLDQRRRGSSESEAKSKERYDAAAKSDRDRRGHDDGDYESEDDIVDYEEYGDHNDVDGDDESE